jgi:multidrug resistance efflux pump
MTFVNSEAPRLVATFPPNALRHIRVGDPAEIALDRHPGEILNARVATLVDISVEGQLAPSGDIPDWTEVAPTSRFAVRFELAEESSGFELPRGAGGAAAVYTEKGKAIRIVRKVVIRMYTWLNYFF